MKFKRLSAILVVAILLVTTLTTHVSALEEGWLIQFRSYFPMLYQGSGETGYISAIQRFLLCHSSSATVMADAGGIDGIYGGGTANAVKAFQRYAGENFMFGIDVDGLAGGDTWASVATELNNDQDGSAEMRVGSVECWLESGQTLEYLNRYDSYTYFHTIRPNP